MAAPLTAAPKRRVALFGGSFDPVHNAHLALARAALQALDLHEVRWVPAGQPWQKAHKITDAVHRVAMVELAIASEPRFVLDNIEIRHQGPSYTLQTLKALQAAQPDTEWTLLIGQDQYSGLHTWHDWPTLLSLATLAVANRPGDKRTPHPDVQRQRHHMVPLPMLDISSTRIRQQVAMGQDISEWVPPAVARYIEDNGLYRSPAGS